MGDFNVVRNVSERKGSTFHNHRGAEFNDFIVAADLQELKLGGRRFTWIGMGKTKLSKLDRFLISTTLLHEWPQAHNCLLLRLKGPLLTIFRCSSNLHLLTTLSSPFASSII